MGMKNSVVIFFAFAALCFVSCSSGDEPIVENAAYASFLQDTVTVSWAGGKTFASVKSFGTEWEIVIDDGIGMINEILPKVGGSEEDIEKFQQITITCNENNTANVRTQKIFLVNKKSGDRTTLVVKQAGPYTPVTVTVSNTEKYQHVMGFGGMYNPIIWLRNNLITDAEITKMYDPNQLGYNLLRLMVYPNKDDWADVAGAGKHNNMVPLFLLHCDCTDAFAEKLLLMDGNISI